MRRTAVIRADAGPDIGGGHVMRCLALATALAPLGWDIAFASREGTVEAVPSLAASGFPVLRVDGAEAAEAQAIASHVPYGCDLVVVDHYRRDAAFENACRTFASRVAVLDDMPGQRPHAADVLIDGAPGRTAEDWCDTTDADHILAGADYALIRPEIVALREASLARRGGSGIDRVLISFGLTDAAHATESALRAAREAFPGARIDVVTGPAASHQSMQRLAAVLDARVHAAPSDYPGMLAAADLAIGAGGVSALERACLGVPSVAVELAVNQRGILTALSEAGALLLVEQVDGSSFEWPLAGMMHLNEGNEARQHMSQAGAGLIDGQGAHRAARALDSLAYDSGEP